MDTTTEHALPDRMIGHVLRESLAGPGAAGVRELPETLCGPHGGAVSCVGHMHRGV